MHLRAYAKINPYLNVTGKRQDGYHDLSIVFRPVSLYDEVTVEERAEKGVVLTCSDEALAGPENIIFKAYEALLKARPEAPGYKVHIDKNIPSGAGMGGGSSDAAAFLRGADTVSALGLTEEELGRIGASVGADVPACLLKHPSIGGGIGDVLAPAPAPARIYYIIVKPPVSFSTPAMYKKYDELLAAGRLPSGIPSVSSVIKAMEKGDIRAEMTSAFNIFEEVIPERKLIGDIKNELINSGACGALMTGSGSAVFGAFESKADRDRAYRYISGQTKAEGSLKGCFTASCESVNEKEQIQLFKARRK